MKKEIVTNENEIIKILNDDFDKLKNVNYIIQVRKT